MYGFRRTCMCTPYMYDSVNTALLSVRLVLSQLTNDHLLLLAQNCGTVRWLEFAGLENDGQSKNGGGKCTSGKWRTTSQGGICKTGKWRTKIGGLGFGGLEFGGLKNDGLENDGVQLVNLHGTWLWHVASIKEWLQSKTWVEQRYNIAQHNITACVNVTFSCNDYDNVYALVDWRLVFFHFLSTVFILCCSLKNMMVIMHCNTDKNTTRSYCY